MAVPVQKENFFAVLGNEDGEDISKLVKRVTVTSVAKKKEQQEPIKDVKKEKSQLNPEMLRAKPIILPDYVRRREIVLRKPKAKREGHQGYGFGNSHANGCYYNGYNQGSYTSGAYGGAKKNHGNNGGPKSNKKSVVKAVGDEDWQVCRHPGGRKGGEGKKFNDYSGLKNVSIVFVGNQQIEDEKQEQDAVAEEPKGRAESKQENSENKSRNKGENRKTLECERVLLEKMKAEEEYEKALLGKRKALEALKEIEARRVTTEKEKSLSRRRKCKKDKLRKKEGPDKEEKEKDKRSTAGLKLRGFFGGKVWKKMFMLSALGILVTFLPWEKL